MPATSLPIDDTSRRIASMSASRLLKLLAVSSSTFVSATESATAALRALSSGTSSTRDASYTSA